MIVNNLDDVVMGDGEQSGMSKREYMLIHFAANAPDVPRWFQADFPEDMPELKPDPHWSDEEFDLKSKARSDSQVAQNRWFRRRDSFAFFQWRKYYAEQMAKTLTEEE